MTSAARLAYTTVSRSNCALVHLYNDVPNTELLKRPTEDMVNASAAVVSLRDRETTPRRFKPA
jgi:hypothetical protein